MNFLCLTQSQDAMFGMVASAIQMIRAGKTAYTLYFSKFIYHWDYGQGVGQSLCKRWPKKHGIMVAHCLNRAPHTIQWFIIFTIVERPNIVD